MSNTYKTLKQFTDEMLTELMSRTDKIKSFNNDVIYGLFSAISSQLGFLQLLIKFIFKSFYVYTSNGKFLDARGRDWDTERKPALYSTGLILITRQNSATKLEINAGEVFTTELNENNETKEYILSEKITMDIGVNYGVGTIQSSVIGTIGNTSENTVIRSKRPLTGISSITNEEAITNGTDLETDYSLRNRIALKRLSLAEGCNERAIKSKVLEINGIDYCFLDYDKITPALIYCYVNNKAGNINDGLIYLARQAVYRQEGFGITSITQASPVEYVDIYLKIRPTYLTTDTDKLKSTVKYVLSEYINSLEPNSALRISDLVGIIEKISNVDYIVNNNGLQIKINSLYNDYLTNSRISLIRTDTSRITVDIE